MPNYLSHPTSIVYSISWAWNRFLLIFFKCVVCELCWIFYSPTLDITLRCISHLCTMHIGVVCKLLFISIFLKQALGMFVLILDFVLILLWVILIWRRGLIVGGWVPVLILQNVSEISRLFYTLPRWHGKTSLRTCIQMQCLWKHCEGLPCTREMSWVRGVPEFVSSELKAPLCWSLRGMHS